jgi:hypothetical protein
MQDAEVSVKKLRRESVEDEGGGRSRGVVVGEEERAETQRTGKHSRS